jgi:hypothetical protein
MYRALVVLWCSSLAAVDIGQLHQLADGNRLFELRRALQMFLDTGANASVLYPSFRDALTREETFRLRIKREKTAGAGGMIKRKTQLIPTLRIEVFETSVNLRKLSLRDANWKQPISRRSDRNGCIWSGFLLGLDAMKLEVK